MVNDFGFWSAGLEPKIFSALAVNSFGDQSYRLHNIEDVVNTVADTLCATCGVHVTGTQDWFRETPSFCEKEAHQDAWKSWDKVDKKAYLADVREKKFRFK